MGEVAAPRLPVSYFRESGASDTECELLESAFPDGVILGLQFVDFLLSNGVDVDDFARRVLEGGSLDRYSGFYARARSVHLRAVRAGAGAQEVASSSFDRDCGVMLVGCLLRSVDWSSV